MRSRRASRLVGMLVGCGLAVTPSPPKCSDGGQQTKAQANLRKSRATVVRLAGCALVAVGAREHADLYALVELGCADAQDETTHDSKRSRSHRLCPAPVLLGSPKSGPAGALGLVEHWSRTS